jgi:DNA-binding beta-propeller fold protein YncE
MSAKRIAGAVIALTLVTACAGTSSNGTSAPFTPQANDAPQSKVGAARLASLVRSNATTYSSVYVANYAGNTVTVYAVNLSASAMQYLRKITNGVSNPRAVAYDNAGHLYVANAGNNTVTKYDETNSDALLSTISSGISNPAALAIDANNNLWVANQGNNTVTEYAAGTRSVAQSLSYGVNAPTALAVSPGGASIAVANTGNNSVTCYNVGTGARGRVITSGINYPMALAWDPSSNLYVANYRANTVTQYQQGATTINHTFSNGVAGPDAITVDPSDEYLWVGNVNGNTVTQYNTSGGLVQTYNQYAFMGETALASGAAGSNIIVSVGTQYVTALFYDPTLPDFNPNPTSVFAPADTGLSEPVAIAISH